MKKEKPEDGHLASIGHWRLAYWLYSTKFRREHQIYSISTDSNMDKTHQIVNSPLFLVHMSLYSLKITNADQYAKFKVGTIGAEYDVIRISPEAHLAPLMEPKHYASSSYYKIVFTDRNGNAINLFPRNKGVVVEIASSGHIPINIPDDYDEYKYVYLEGAVFPDDHLEHILACKNTTFLYILDFVDVVYRLLNRIDDLKALQNLDFLKLNINPANLSQITLSTFLEQLPSLRAARFIFHDLEDIESYLKMQTIPRQWERHGDAVDTANFHRCLK